MGILRLPAFRDVRIERQSPADRVLTKTSSDVYHQKCAPAFRSQLERVLRMIDNQQPALRIHRMEVSKTIRTIGGDLDRRGVPETHKRNDLGVTGMTQTLVRIGFRLRNARRNLVRVISKQQVQYRKKTITIWHSPISTRPPLPVQSLHSILRTARMYLRHPST